MPQKSKIISFAKSCGADLVGIANVGVYADYLEQVSARLAETGATGEDYMVPGNAASFFESLSDARHALASAKSVILLGVYSFDREGDYSATRQRLQGKTARTYAYYPVVRQVAEKVVEYIEQAGYEAVHGQQIPLKYVAHSIGLGSYGWNGLLLTEEFGSYLALRAVITDVELEPDAFSSPTVPCENCGRCLKACPTGALYAPYRVHPALCINPLTRKEDDIPPSLRKKMGNWVHGCDICQQVCPTNRELEPRVPDPRAGFDPVHHTSHRTLAGLTRTPDLASLIAESDEIVMVRNAIIALANIGTPEAIEILRRNENLHTKSLGEYIAWAIDRIAKRTSS
jgi:epoxyqueuosine reductase